MNRFPPLTRWVLWFALSSAIVVYLVVLKVSGSTPSPVESEEGGVPLAMILTIAGFVLGVVSQGIKILANRVQTENGKPKVPFWIDQAFVIALAMGEAPAILGLVLAFQGAPAKEYLPLFGIAIVGMILLAPKFFYAVESRAESAD